MTSFARIAILDLVLGKILPNERHPDNVFNDCGSALFEELCNHHEFFFIGISTKRIKWCEEDGLSSLVAFLSTQNDTFLEDRLNAERTTL